MSTSKSDQDTMAWQTTYKAQLAYCKEKPAWASLSLEAINRWGRGEATLTLAIAEALEAAYAAGVAGEYPEVPASPVTTLIRRSRPSAEPEPEPMGQRVRRTKPTPQISRVIRRSK